MGLAASSSSNQLIARQPSRQVRYLFVISALELAQFQHFQRRILHVERATVRNSPHLFNLPLAKRSIFHLRSLYLHHQHEAYAIRQKKRPRGELDRQLALAAASMSGRICRLHFEPRKQMDARRGPASQPHGSASCSWQF